MSSRWITLRTPWKRDITGPAQTSDRDARDAARVLIWRSEMSAAERMCVCVVIVMSSEFRHLCSTICLLVCLKTRTRAAQGTSRVKALYYSLTTSHPVNNLCLTLSPLPSSPFCPILAPSFYRIRQTERKWCRQMNKKKKGTNLAKLTLKSVFTS